MSIPNGSTYRIYLSRGLLDGVGEKTASLVAGRKALIVSDANVAPHYLERVCGSFARGGFEVAHEVVAAGEASKCLENASRLWDACARCGLGRDGVVVALGGGVVGDLAGFVAATWLRGVACVQVPTTLLAMVDSSIGGKTALDIDAGKNLVGAFAQPVLVACDFETLATLPEAEWANGFAEIAKSAVIEGGGFYEWLAAHAEGLRGRDYTVVQGAVARSLVFKGRVVAADEREGGVRECLNYGHTFAHALEAAAGLGTVSHGRAVAEGMRFAARLGTEAAGVTESFVAQQAALLDALGLRALDAAWPADELFARMAFDKKARGGMLRFVFATAPGIWQTMTVDADLVKIHLILWEQGVG
jgi:3-dehydroquinate synthase